MSVPDHDETDKPDRLPWTLVKVAIRYILTFAVVVAVQVGIEKLVFGEVWPDRAFEANLLVVLDAFDPLELTKLWAESWSGYSEAIDETPEYAACMKKSGASAVACWGEAEFKRRAVRVGPPYDWFPASLARSVWNVVAYQFGSDQSPAYRMVALWQIILGFSSMTAIMSGLMMLRQFRSLHPFLLVAIYLVGCVVLSSLLAIPLKALVLAFTSKLATGVYATTGVRAVNKTVDSLMHTSLERALEAASSPFRLGKY